MGAEAYTVGEDVFLRKGTSLSTPEGRQVLDHELAHVAQYRKGMLDRPDSELERQADQIASKESSDSTPGERGTGTEPRVLRKDGARCTSVSLRLPNHIVFYGTKGAITATAELTADIPAGTYDVRYDASDGSLKLDPWPTGDLVFTVSGSISGSEATIAAYQKKFQDYMDSLTTSPVKLKVTGKASSATQEGDHKGKGGAGAGEGAKDKAGGEKKDDGGTGTGIKSKVEPRKDASAGAPGGKEGGKGAGGEAGTEPPKEPGKGDPGGTSPVPQQGSHGPIVRIEDASQIDELKRRGVLDDKLADSIKDKGEKQQELSFEETIALLDALSQSMVTRPPGADKDPDKARKKESWVDVARFIKENKDKFSGQQATGDDGMSLAEMQAILAKYHEFVGVKDAPKPKEPGIPADRVEKFDPAKRKSWNSLDNWEKDIWKQYSAKYGEPGTDSGSDDLKLTPQMKFRIALGMSPSFMKEGAREAADALFHDPIFIGGTILGITLWVAAWLAPEPLFSKAFAAAITIAMLSVFSVTEIRNVAVAWMRLQDEAEAATTFSELEDAAEHFGKAMGGTGLRVLVMLATVVAGKAIPSPKGPVGGGPSGMAPATAGGPSVALAAEAAEIKVLADGTIVILGSRGGTIVQSTMSSGGGGGGSKGGGTKGGGKAPDEQKVTPKEEKPPADTHEIKTPSRWGPDVEQQQGVGKQVGNFAHKFYEKLKTFLPNNSDVVSEDLAPGLEPEHRIKNPAYKDARTAPRIDRLDPAKGMVNEIKPKGLYEQGLAEAKAYAMEMDKYEPLPNGQRWKAECITYDFDAVLEYMRKIGYLSEEEVAKFLGKASKGK